MSDIAGSVPNHANLKNDEALRAIKILLKDISKRHNKTYSEVISELAEENKEGRERTKEQHPKDEKETRKDAYEKDEKKKDLQDSAQLIPILIFSHDAGYLELIVGYAKDTLGLSFSNIAKALDRDQRTIWSSYSNLKKKISSPIRLDKANIAKEQRFIPLDAFKDRRFSTFENLLIHLSKTHSTKEIAAMLGKDYRTIWTVLSRARRKKR